MPGADGSYVRPGFLVFYRAGAYQAVRFDLASLAVSGDPVTVLTEDGGLLPDGSIPTLSVSASGAVAYVPAALMPSSTFGWLSEGGKTDPLGFPIRMYDYASLSPTGRQIATGVLEGGGYVIRLLDLDRHTDDALELPGINWNPTWNPDGRRIAMRSMVKGDYDIYAKDVTTAAPPTKVLATPFDETPLVWLSDHAMIIQQSDSAGQYWMKRFGPSAPDRIEPFANYTAGAASVSADGVWIAFADTASEVYVRKIAGDSLPERLTSNGGKTPVWSRKGNELYYLRDQDVIALTGHDDNGHFHVDRERVFAHLALPSPRGLIAGASDGRLLVSLPGNPVLPPQVRLILNWPVEIARKLAR
jgi:hypothetical protein